MVICEIYIYETDLLQMIESPAKFTMGWGFHLLKLFDLIQQITHYFMMAKNRIP